MSDKELIQALRCCEKLNGCCVCPACEDDCRGVSCGHAAGRLEALLAENEQLEKMVNRHELFEDALQAANEALIAENDHFRDLAKWHSGDELPPKFGEYIVHVKHAETAACLEFIGTRGARNAPIWIDDFGETYSVDAWMHLPAFDGD